jgi:hypothetical protein
MAATHFYQFNNVPRYTNLQFDYKLFMPVNSIVCKSLNVSKSHIYFTSKLNLNTSIEIREEICNLHENIEA